MRNDERKILEKKRVSLEEWLPDSRQWESYAVFGGDIFQRNIAVEQGIARCFGHRAIFVIHNNLSLEGELKNLLSIYPDLEAYRYTPTTFVNSQNRNYMPFWGLDGDRIQEVLYPEAGQSQYKSGVRSYLRILEYEKKPYTLTNLLHLSQKKFEKLEMEDLNNIPDEIRDEIEANLLADDVMGKVKNDIESFAGVFRSSVWDEREEEMVNLLAAVKNKALISVYLPVRSGSVLDYLAVELEMILESNLDFLIVIDSINIEDGRMKRILLNPSLNMSKIIAADTVGDVCSSVRNSGEEILHRFQKIVLFKCANSLVAKTYSDIIGSYLKTIESKTVNNTRRIGNWGSDRTKGKSVSQQLAPRLEPEELVALGTGAVLIDQETEWIEKAGRIEELE